MRRWAVVGTLLIVAAGVLAGAAGCGDSSSGDSAPGVASTTKTKRSHHRHAQPKPKHRHHRSISAAAACPAPSRTLRGVYHPYRLVVLSPCQYAAGSVLDVRHEEDGDLHVIVRLDRPYRRLLNATNYSQQHGGLVVEFMPRDGGHLPEPSVGARLSLIGAWVLDTDHGWRELHPVFLLKMNGHTYRSGPQFGGSPAGDYSSSAAEDCRTPAGRRCVGYGGSSSSSGGGGNGGGGGGSGGTCTPGYSPCLTYHGGDDYDCAGGSGNGPYYTASGVTYTVSGADPYDLDSDGDGFGCE
jgi:hypothetical protein